MIAVTVPRRRRRLLTVLVLAALAGWWLDVEWGGGACEPRDVHPAVTR